jgi:hypothetical protein
MLEEKGYPRVIKELEDFRDTIIRYFRLRSELGYSDPYRSISEKDEAALNQLRQDINQRSPVIKYYFEEVNESYILHGRAPAVIGGFPYSTDVFDSLFDTGSPLRADTDKVIDMLNQCIGKYHFMVKTKKSIVDINVAPIFEVINSIEQNLRKCFKKQPAVEIEVQDEVEKILSIRQVKYARDTESFQYSSKGYKPDFVLEDFNAVIEIKLCNTKNDEKKIIAEINDDIQAYLSKYKLAVFFVYDVSVIRDVDLFKNDLTRNPKVLVCVIKH